MKPTLKDATLVPPDGFWYKEPATGVKLDGQSLSGTAEKVVLHRQANGLPRQSKEEALEDIQEQICWRVPSEFCHSCDHPVWSLSFKGIIKALNAFIETLKTVASGDTPFVAQSEADARAAACAKCFHNREAGTCSGCAFGEMLRKLFGLTIGDRTTNSDGKMHGCEVCGCHCRTIVWYKKELVNEGLSDGQKAAYSAAPLCWRK